MSRNQRLHKIPRPEYSVRTRDLNEALEGRGIVRDGIVSLGDKLKSVQEKLDAERAKPNPNPVVISRCETVIANLKEILSNAAKTHVIPQNVR